MELGDCFMEKGRTNRGDGTAYTERLRRQSNHFDIANKIFELPDMHAVCVSKFMIVGVRGWCLQV